MESLDVDGPHSMGTTIIGVTYDGGVVLGANSRISTVFIWEPATVKVAANLVRLLAYNNKRQVAAARYFLMQKG
ncbi:hypothetical protein MLD38_015187 [Melastoma candidum]|uniref:Uncharacterized protein n=1 Tax=Melastoma candidum TaxID=119954 RepID=A0ACB9RID4_9MYRT|nr:hypothetical protein MLD38_015187 [Melastoma candidum]